MQICCGFGGILGEIRENFWECAHILNKSWDFLQTWVNFALLLLILGGFVSILSGF